jgi:hypothetical protein
MISYCCPCPESWYQVASISVNRGAGVDALALCLGGLDRTRPAKPHVTLKSECAAGTRP